LLEAELETLKARKNTQGIKALHDESIRFAAKAGFRHEQALACEKAGYSFLGKQDQDSAPTALSYFEKSRDLYDEWGALIKVEQLYDLLNRWNGLVQLVSIPPLLRSKQNPPKIEYV
jgi:hypothetical protein